MSYILDALKKAEQKRQLAARVPTLATVHRAPDVTPRLRVWPWVAGIVVAVNAAALAWLFYPPGRPDDPVTPSARAHAPSPTAATGPPAEMPAAPAASLARATIAKPDARGAETDDRAATASPPPAPSLTAPRPIAEPRSAPTSKASERKPAAPAVPPVPDARPAPQKPPAAVAPPPPARAAASPSGPAGAVAEDEPASRAAATQTRTPGAAGASVPPRAPAPPGPASPQQTPQAVQEMIAKLKLQMVVYSDVPSERLVFINNQKYLEGHSVDGLHIETITPDGAVLTFQGRRFELRQ